MYRYFIWIPIGALSASHFYLISKGFYNKTYYNRYRFLPHVKSINDIFLNGGFLLGGLLGYTYVYLNQPIINYLIDKYITK